MIQNLNSLKGEQWIDFTEKPLSVAGLFVIIGPTGSGKSTILDAVCLALYNRIPRFGGVVSKAMVYDTGALITKGTREAMALVEYECKKGIFTSKWSIAFNRNDNLNDYHLELANSDGELIVQKKSEVPPKNEELIGLNYEQFVRSVLLAQGDFSKFLKSDPKERGALLEKITGSEVYRKLGIKAFEKYKETSSKENQLKQEVEIHSKQLLPEAQYLEVKKEFENEEKNLQQLKELLNKIEGSIQLKEELDQERENLKKCSSELHKRQVDKEEFNKIKGKKLERHHLLIPQLKPLETIKSMEEKLSDITEEIERNNNRQKDLSNQNADIIKEVQEFIGKELDEHHVHKEFMRLSTHYHSVKQELEVVTASYKEKQKYIAESLNIIEVSLDYNIPEIELKRIQELYEEEKKPLKELLDKWNYKDIKQLDYLLEDREKNKGHLIELIHRKEVFDQKSKDFLKVKSLIQSHQERRGSIPKKLEELRVEKQIAQKTRNQIEIEKEKKDLTKRLEEYREKLVDGEPCPLCGSTDHPWHIHQPELSFDKLEEQLASEGKRIEELVSEMARINSLNETLQDTIDDLAKEEELTREEIKKIKDEMSKIELQLSDVSKDGEWAEAHKNMQAEIKELKELKQLVEREKHWIKIIGILEDLSELKKKGKMLRGELNEIYPGKDFDSRINNLRTRLDQVKASINEVSSSAETLMNSFTKMESELHSLKNKVQEDVVDLGFENISEAIQAILPGEVHKSLMDEKSKIEKSIDQLNGRLETIQKIIENKSKKDSNKSMEQLQEGVRELTPEIEKLIELRDELSSKIRNQKELKNRVTQLKKELKTERKKNRKWILLYEEIGSQWGDKFAKFAQFLTLQRLLVLANKRLDKLSRRYLLDLPESSESKDLVIIDKEMGMERRSVKTLSGGESFLVSLGLALALSDMASKNISIGSLFIDEGFGTLDSDILDQVISTLEQLQMDSQKTIGVISHISDLKDRIATRIKVEQNGQGLGQIMVEG